MQILYRTNLSNKEELVSAKKYFSVVQNRTAIQPASQVVGRYSVLPFYRELEEDLLILGSRLINSYREHCYIANFDYYWDLLELTPATYFNLSDIPDWGGPFVVKGRTNSRKLNWNSQMFARNKSEAINIALDLLQDSLISEQGVIVRDYCPLVKLEEGLNGLPVVNEWRLFFYKETIISYGHYWQNFTDITLPLFTQEALNFAQDIAKKVSSYTSFYVLDIAEKADGGWTLIEVNDGQMSGLNGQDPDLFYRNLKELTCPSSK